MHGDICFYKSKMHSHSKLKKPRRFFFINKVYLGCAKKSLVQQGSEISWFCFNQAGGSGFEGLVDTSPNQTSFFSSLPTPPPSSKQKAWLG